MQTTLPQYTNTTRHLEYTYDIIYRNVKYSRLELRPGVVKVVVPRGEVPEEIIEKHRGWIEKKMCLLRDALADAEGREVSSRDDPEFRFLVTTLAAEISVELKVDFNRLCFREMTQKWASCSSKGNLTFNTRLKHLPERLLEYIVFHEIAHLIELNHDGKFWKLISDRFVEYKQIEKELSGYWLLIQDMK